MVTDEEKDAARGVHGSHSATASVPVIQVGAGTFAGIVHKIDHRVAQHRAKPGHPIAQKVHTNQAAILHLQGNVAVREWGRRQSVPHR